jgi:cell division protein FtsN
MGTRGRRGSTGSLLVLLGAVSILALTFTTGVYTGRVWWRPVATTPAAKAPAPPPPTLTFYHELTAPLAAPPPPPRPGKAPRPLELRPAEPAAPPAPTAAPPVATAGPPAAEAAPLARAAEPVEPPAAAEPARADLPARTEPATGGEAGLRFTVQVAAYNTRGAAETLRAALAASGHDAYVVEGETAAGIRYRVRVGAFATREAAREAAARLGAERAAGAFVTAR